MIIFRMLLVLLLVTLVGCDKIKFPYADTTGASDSPQYSEAPNLNGGVRKIEPNVAAK